MIESSNSNPMVMPVSPMYGSGNDGFGNNNGSMWWFLILFFLLGGRGWGYGGYGPNGSNNSSTSSEIQRGFDQSSVMNGINGISSSICNGFAGVNNALCNGFAGVNASINSAFAGAEANANARQIANMQQAFAAQTAVSNGMNSLANSLSNCCCENRAGIADLKYTVATENCADRAALSDSFKDLTYANNTNTQALLNAINSGIQSIKDDLCADRLEAVKTENANLRTQLNLASLAASQNEQTAAIQAGQRTLANEIEQYVLPTPRPAYMVQNPNCCQTQSTCGCAF